MLWLASVAKTTNFEFRNWIKMAYLQCKSTWSVFFKMIWEMRCKSHLIIRKPHVKTYLWYFQEGQYQISSCLDLGGKQYGGPCYPEIHWIHRHGAQTLTSEQWQHQMSLLDNAGPQRIFKSGHILFLLLVGRQRWSCFSLSLSCTFGNETLHHQTEHDWKI